MPATGLQRQLPLLMVTELGKRGLSPSVFKIYCKNPSLPCLQQLPFRQTRVLSSTPKQASPTPHFAPNGPSNNSKSQVDCNSSSTQPINKGSSSDKSLRKIYLTASNHQSL